MTLVIKVLLLNTTVESTKARKLAVVEPQLNNKKLNRVTRKQYVNDSIIKEKKPASIKLLHDIYGIGIGCTRYRQKLKERLKKISVIKFHFLVKKIRHYQKL